MSGDVCRGEYMGWVCWGRDAEVGPGEGVVSGGWGRFAGFGAEGYVLYVGMGSTREAENLLVGRASRVHGINQEEWNGMLVRAVLQQHEGEGAQGR